MGRYISLSLQHSPSPSISTKVQKTQVQVIKRGLLEWTCGVEEVVGCSKMVIPTRNELCIFSLTIWMITIIINIILSLNSATQARSGSAFRLGRPWTTLKELEGIKC